MVKIKKIWIIVCLYTTTLIRGVLGFNEFVSGQSIPVNTLFLTLTNGTPGKTYTLIIQDIQGHPKDRLAITPDSPITNLNYSPPPGVIIYKGDEFCSSPTSCIPINEPDTFGTSLLTINLQ
jgi:hypothetical protein